MKIGAHFYASITDRADDILKIVYGEFLRDYVDDLVARRNIGFILISDQLVYFFLGNLILRILPDDIAAGLQAFNMMSRNAHIYFRYNQVGIRSIAIIQGHSDG